MKAGYPRAKINGELCSGSKRPRLDKKFKQRHRVVVDRVRSARRRWNSVSDSLEQAPQTCRWVAMAENADDPITPCVFGEFAPARFPVSPWKTSSPVSFL